jgi:hypothetical protein
MTPEEQHQDFINSAVRLLSQRPNSVVMVLVATPGGLEILCSSADFMVEFGILKTATETVTMRFHEQSKAELTSGQREARETMIAIELSDKKGGVN